MLVLLFVILATSGISCAPVNKRVVIEIDGTRRVIETQAATVSDILRQQNIVLSDDDRVEPPLFAEVGRSAAITITRIQIRTEVEHLPLPFTRKLVRDEFYPDGQLRVIQLGANGTAEVIWAISIEHGREVSRREVLRKVIVNAKDEILALGTQGSIPAVPISGTIAYLANGNAWVMRQSSANKRPLTRTGDLDGRVFSLSADGRILLFSRASDEDHHTLNSLWLIDTLVLGEQARALPLGNALSAHLSIDGRVAAYSTGVKTAGVPGWKAHNDLWIATELTSTQITKQQIWKPSMPSPYSWWGANFAWSSDARALAYAFPNEIGWVELNKPIQPGESISPRRPLKRFAPFATRADWVWLPQVSWSPDNRFIAGVVHAPLTNPNVANDNVTFEVWVFGRDGAVAAPLARQTGMWSAPTWSGWDDRREAQIAFGVALSPSDSERSRYALALMDRDGGNKRQILPLASESGLTMVQIAWSPNARQLLAIREGDVWLFDLASSRWTQLTANGASALPRWGR